MTPHTETPPERPSSVMAEPDPAIIDAALDGLSKHPLRDLYLRLAAMEDQERARELHDEIDRLDWARRLWHQVEPICELVEIDMNGDWLRIKETQARWLILDRYREVGRDGAVLAWIEAL